MTVVFSASPFLVWPVKHTADIIVHALDRAQVPLHIPLEFELGQLSLGLERQSLA